MNTDRLFIRKNKSDKTLFDTRITKTSGYWTFAIPDNSVHIFDSWYYTQSSGLTNAMYQDISYLNVGITYGLISTIMPSWIDCSMNGSIKVTICDSNFNVINSWTYSTQDDYTEYFTYTSNMRYLCISYSANTTLGIARIYIDNSIEKETFEVELDDNVKIETTYSIEYLEDLTKKSSDFSYTINIPATEHNKVLFENLDVISRGYSDTSYYSVFDAFLTRKDVNVLSGLLTIIRFMRKDTREYFECKLNNNFRDFYDRCSNDLLYGNTDITKDLSFAEYTYLMSENTIKNQLDPTTPFTYGVGCNFIGIDKTGVHESGISDNILVDKNIAPYLFIGEVINKIVKKHGYELESDFISGNWAPTNMPLFDFRRLIIPLGGESMSLPETYTISEGVGFDVEGNVVSPWHNQTAYSQIVSGQNIYSIPNYNNLVGDGNDPVSSGNSFQMNVSNSTITQSTYNYLQISGIYYSPLTLEYTFNFDLDIVNRFIAAGYPNTLTSITIYRNANTGDFTPQVENHIELYCIDTNEVIWTSPSVYSAQAGSYTSNSVLIMLESKRLTGDATFIMKGGMNYCFRLVANLTYAIEAPSTMTNTEWGWWSEYYYSGGQSGAVAFSWQHLYGVSSENNPFILELKPKLNSSVLYQGQYQNPTYILPKNTKQIDFLNSIMKMFNLYVYRKDDKILKIEPYERFYDESLSMVKDWTDKLDTNECEITRDDNMIQGTFDFRYTDDKDWLTTNYYNSVGRYWGEYLNLGSDEKKKQEIKLIFAPCANAYYSPNRKDFICPHLFSSPNWKENNGVWTFSVDDKFEPAPRILYLDRHYQWNLTSPFWLFRHAHRPDDFDIMTEWGGVFPYAGHFNAPSNETIDLNFNACQWYYGPDPNGSGDWATYNNLYNIFYYNKIQLMTNSTNRIVKYKLTLSPLDIYNYQYNDVIFIKGIKYRCLKIDGWSSQEEPVECVLLKL